MLEQKNKKHREKLQFKVIETTKTEENKKQTYESHATRRCHT